MKSRSVYPNSDGPPVWMPCGVYLSHHGQQALSHHQHSTVSTYQCGCAVNATTLTLTPYLRSCVPRAYPSEPTNEIRSGTVHKISPLFLPGFDASPASTSSA